MPNLVTSRTENTAMSASPLYWSLKLSNAAGPHSPDIREMFNIDQCINLMDETQTSSCNEVAKKNVIGPPGCINLINVKPVDAHDALHLLDDMPCANKLPDSNEKTCVKKEGEEEPNINDPSPDGYFYTSNTVLTIKFDEEDIEFKKTLQDENLFVHRKDGPTGNLRCSSPMQESIQGTGKQELRLVKEIMKGRETCLSRWWRRFKGKVSAKREISDEKKEDVRGKSTSKKSTSLGLKSTYVSPTEKTLLSEGTEVKKMILTDFRLLEVLGQGTFGKVFLARLNRTGDLFAIKRFKKEFMFREKHVKYLRMERKILILSHKCCFLTDLKFAFQTKNFICFGLEYCPGGDLWTQMERIGRFTESQTRFYTAEITQALMFLHDRGVIHRDLKPGNILLDTEGHCKVADFGTCMEKGPTGMRVSSTMGTPNYCAPEVLRKIPHGASVDWWALGIIIFELIMGYRPFDADSKEVMYKNIIERPARLSPDMSEATLSILSGFLKKNPDKRLGCVEENGRENAVLRHVFFSEIDWVKLRQKEITPPIIPQNKHARDRIQKHVPQRTIPDNMSYIHPDLKNKALLYKNDSSDTISIHTLHMDVSFTVERMQEAWDKERDELRAEIRQLRGLIEDMLKEKELSKSDESAQNIAANQQQ